MLYCFYFVCTGEKATKIVCLKSKSGCIGARKICMYRCTHAYTHMYTHRRIHIHTSIHTYTHTYMHIHISPTRFTFLTFVPSPSYFLCCCGMEKLRNTSRMKFYCKFKNFVGMFIRGEISHKVY